MNNHRGYGHQHIDIQGNLPETFRFNLHPEPSLAEIDSIPDGSEMILLAWSPDSPPPTIEGFEMGQEWKAFAHNRVPDEERGKYPDDEVKFANLFLFSLAQPDPGNEVPNEDQIIDALVTREEYTLDEVHILVREAVRRAREGMVVKPF